MVLTVNDKIERATSIVLSSYELLKADTRKGQIIDKVVDNKNINFGQWRKIDYNGELETRNALPLPSEKFTDNGIYADEIHGIFNILGAKSGLVVEFKHMPTGNFFCLIKPSHRTWESIMGGLDKKYKNLNDQKFQPMSYKKGVVTWKDTPIDISSHWAVVLALNVLGKQKNVLFDSEKLKREYNSFCEKEYEECVQNEQLYCKRYKKIYTNVSASRAANNSLKVLLKEFDTIKQPKIFPIQNQGSGKNAKMIWLTKRSNKASRKK